MGQLQGSLELNARVLDCLLDDVARLLHVPPLTLDKAYIRQRLANEGMPFLTTTLPQVGKACDCWVRSEGNLDFGPCFSASFLKTLKIALTGARESLDRATALRSLRQLGYLYYKYERPYSESQVHKAIADFESVDRELAVQEIPWYSEEFQFAQHLVSRLISRDRFLELTEIMKPRHGPGAVASGEKGPQKWSFKRIFPLVGHVCDYREMYHLRPYAPISDEETSSNLIVDPFPTSRLVDVPKDSRGPRLICEEPLEMQYLQQWLFQILDQLIEEAWESEELSMRSQLRNQTLAAEGSITQGWSTIDMKEASDRVSLALVLNLFPKWLEPWLRAFRSDRVKLPDGRIIPSLKFAPMGSAICFPIESITFWALSKAVCVLNGHSNRLPCPTASVFGDDIIVPNAMCGPVCQMLESCGLVVNRAKTYDTGFFRESCGLDAYYGIDVSPVRVKKDFPSSWRNAEGLSNYVAVSNGLYDHCFTDTATLLAEELTKVAPLLCSKSSNGLRLECCNKTPRTRWNRDLHRTEVLTYRLGSPRKPFDEGPLRMRRSLISPVSEGDPSVWSPPRSTRVEKGWVRYLDSAVS